MSKSELLAKLKLVRAQTDATVELLNNSASLPLSLDDEYEADYLIGCLESNSQKLYALANKCRSAAKSGQREQNVETAETGRLMPASAASSSQDDICTNQSANQPAVSAADVDTDDTASLDSSHVSTPLCADSVSSGENVKFLIEDQSATCYIVCQYTVPLFGTFIAVAAVFA